MASISRYVLVDDEDTEQDYEYEKFDEAKAAAQKQGNTAVIEREYEYTDSSLAWAPDGGQEWPPRGKPTPRAACHRPSE